LTQPEGHDCQAFIQKLAAIVDNYGNNCGQLQQQPTTPQQLLLPLKTTACLDTTEVHNPQAFIQKLALIDVVLLLVHCHCLMATPVIGVDTAPRFI
jgi:hypothetical protein